MKAPAYQWYPKDILSSARVAEMDLAEECAYRRALDFCWLNGSLPKDTGKLSRIIGKGCTEEIAKVVAAMFLPDPTDESRLVNDRLEQERAKQAEWSKKSSDAGKKSAELRAEAKARLEAESNQWANQHPTTVQPPLQGWLPNGTNQTATLQFASSSTSKKEEENNAGANENFSPYINPHRGNHCPKWDEVLYMFQHNNGTAIQARAFFDYNEKVEWRDTRGRPIASWQSMVNTWLTNDAARAPAEMPTADDGHGNKINRKIHPDWPLGIPYTPSNILRHKNKMQLETWEQIQAR